MSESKRKTPTGEFVEPATSKTQKLLDGVPKHAIKVEDDTSKVLKIEVDEDSREVEKEVIRVTKEAQKEVIRILKEAKGSPKKAMKVKTRRVGATPHAMTVRGSYTMNIGVARSVERTATDQFVMTPSSEVNTTVIGPVTIDGNRFVSGPGGITVTGGVISSTVKGQPLEHTVIHAPGSGPMNMPSGIGNCVRYVFHF